MIDRFEGYELVELLDISIEEVLDALTEEILDKREDLEEIMKYGR